MEANYYILPIAALIPLLVGAIWYHDSVFGKTWLKAAGLNAEITKTGNMLLIFGLTYVFSLMMTMSIAPMVIHQMGFFQMLQGFESFAESGSEVNTLFNSVMETYGTEFRTAKHGALHGAMGAITLALPIIAIISLFERRSWSYIFVHFGYWLVSLVLMGAVICAFM